MSRLIPSREELDDFVILLKRYLSTCRACYQWDASKSHRWTDSPYVPWAMLKDEVRGRLATADFLVPFGWSHGVQRTMETLRSGQLYYDKTSSHDLSFIPVVGNPMFALRERETVKRVFNPTKAEVMLNDLGRLIEELETVLSAVSKPATPPPT
jgi:hypothetical protein